MSWSAAQYTQFEQQRSRPVSDLLAQIEDRPVRLAADLGCGPGNSTELLKARFPDAAITGVDSSEDMLRAARERLPSCSFVLADLARWAAEAEPVDVILANASLQWVPDHASLLPALLSRLKPGGTLAVQLPDNLGEPAHRAMVEVAQQGPWRETLAGVSQAYAHRESPDWYFRTLVRYGRVNLWRTTYFHPLAGGAAAVVEWFRGSALRPYLELLQEQDREEFLARYKTIIAGSYPALEDGTVLLPFPRIFFVVSVA